MLAASLKRYDTIEAYEDLLETLFVSATAFCTSVILKTPAEVNILDQHDLAVFSSSMDTSSKQLAHVAYEMPTRLSMSTMTKTKCTVIECFKGIRSLLRFRPNLQISEDLIRSVGFACQRFEREATDTFRLFDALIYNIGTRPSGPSILSFLGLISDTNYVCNQNSSTHTRRVLSDTLDECFDHYFRRRSHTDMAVLNACIDCLGLTYQYGLQTKEQDRHMHWFAFIADFVAPSNPLRTRIAAVRALVRFAEASVLHRCGPKDMMQLIQQVVTLLKQSNMALQTYSLAFFYSLASSFGLNPEYSSSIVALSRCYVAEISATIVLTPLSSFGLTLQHSARQTAFSLIVIARTLESICSAEDADYVNTTLQGQ